jgi:pyruvoyl-dependent arginine decarboxylase (PvlArgDC)
VCAYAYIVMKAEMRMYYTIESEGYSERPLFTEYHAACMAALELARRTQHEVRVVRITTPSGFEKQILCVYNVKYEAGHDRDGCPYKT